MTIEPRSEIERLRAENERLRLLLKRARGWVVTCSESKSARADLRKIDEALKL